MVGVCRVKITESAEELKELMHHQPRTWSKERVQMLYLLQSGQAESVTHAAALLGRGRITLQRWLAAYAEGGMVRLLVKHSPPGRGCQIPAAAQAALVERLATPLGFGSYGEIQDWLKTPPKPGSREAVLSSIGARKNDPYVEEETKEIYRKRREDLVEDIK